MDYKSEQHIVKITSIKDLTHDVLEIHTEKPEGYTFIPGQATVVAVNQEEWKDKARPFTFTSLNDDSSLEFIIKTYTDHDGVTNHFRTLKVGDELILHNVWGVIQYKGPGTFIAGGAGVTPFMAIFRQLEQEGEIEGNQLLFANKTEKDIIHKEELTQLLGENFYNILSAENNPKYDSGQIDKDYLSKHIPGYDQNFYICGPRPMIAAMQTILKELGYDDEVIVIEA